MTNNNILRDTIGTVRDVIILAVIMTTAIVGLRYMQDTANGIRASISSVITDARAFAMSTGATIGFYATPSVSPGLLVEPATPTELHSDLTVGIGAAEIAALTNTPTPAEHAEAVRVAVENAEARQFAATVQDVEQRTSREAQQLSPILNPAYVAAHRADYMGADYHAPTGERLWAADSSIR